jgi:ferredoxin
MKAKGARLSYGIDLKMVENYLPMYKAKDSGEFRQRIESNITQIADAVKNRETNRIPLFSFLNRIQYGFLPGENSDLHFSVTPSCNGCMTCAKVCPANNIEMADSRPEFLHKCEHCLACLQNCPEAAIDYKNKTQGKPRYRHFAISLDDMISINI